MCKSPEMGAPATEGPAWLAQRNQEERAGSRAALLRGPVGHGGDNDGRVPAQLRAWGHPCPHHGNPRNPRN